MSTGLKISILAFGAVFLTILIMIYRGERRAAALNVQILYYPAILEAYIDHTFWRGLSGENNDFTPELDRVATASVNLQSTLDSLEKRWSTPIIRKMYLLQAGGALESYSTPSCISKGERQQLWGSAKEYFDAFYELKIPDMRYKEKHFPVDLDSARALNKHWREMFRKRGVIRIENNEYRLSRLTQFQLAFIINHLRHANAQVQRSYMIPPTAVLDTILQLKIKDYQKL